MLWLTASLSGFAQNVRVVNGMVVGKDGAPIFNAMVTPPGMQPVFTNADGKFQVSVPYSVRELRVVVIGCFDQVQEIDGSFLLFKMNVNPNTSSNNYQTATVPKQETSKSAVPKQEMQKTVDPEPVQAVPDAGNKEETVVENTPQKLDKAALDRIAYAQKLLEEHARRDSLMKAKEAAKARRK
jgi:hypothetical protein